MKQPLIHYIASNKRGASTRRKRGTTKRSNSRGKNTVPYLRLAATIIITALFIISLFALNRINPEQTTSVTLPAEVPAKVVKQTKPQADSKDNYSFYSKLKDFEVQIPENSGYSSHRSSDENFVYLIQAGSFKTAEQAERRLVELKLLGLEPKVSSVVNDSGNLWYRVRLGPFPSRSNMAAARGTLISNDIEAMVMKRSY